MSPERTPINIGGLRIGERRRTNGRRATDKYAVPQRDPARQRLLLLLGIAVCVLLVVGGYALGVYSSGYRYEAAARELETLREYTADLEIKYADLLESTARLRQSSQVEHIPPPKGPQ